MGGARHTQRSSDITKSFSFESQSLNEWRSLSSRCYGCWLRFISAVVKQAQKLYKTKVSIDNLSDSEHEPINFQLFPFFFLSRVVFAAWESRTHNFVACLTKCSLTRQILCTHETRVCVCVWWIRLENEHVSMVWCFTHVSCLKCTTLKTMRCMRWRAVHWNYYVDAVGMDLKHRWNIFSNIIWIWGTWITKKKTFEITLYLCRCSFA